MDGNRCQKAHFGTGAGAVVAGIRKLVATASFCGFWAFTFAQFGCGKQESEPTHVDVSGAPALAHDATNRNQKAALAFRAVGTQTPELLHPVLAQMPVGVELKANGSITAARLAWQVFFNGAYTHIGAATSDHPIFAYYNPYSDVVLLGSWYFPISGPPTVSTICAFPGSVLEPGSTGSTRYPSWLSAPDPFSTVAEKIKNRASLLANRFPDASSSPAGFSTDLCNSRNQQLAEIRMTDTLAGLVTIAQLGAEKPVQALFNAAATDSTNALAKQRLTLSPGQLGVLFKVSPLLAKCQPVAGVQTSSKHLVAIFAYVPNPSQLFAIDLNRVGNNDWQISNFISLGFN
jgi:hypothetical protein